MLHQLGQEALSAVGANAREIKSAIQVEECIVFTRGE